MYRLKKRTTQQETFGTKDIDAVNVAAVQGQNENASGMTNQKKNLMFDIGLRVIKIFAIASPGILSWVFKVLLGYDLGKINMWNGIVALFCYCAVTPLVVTPKLGIKDYVLAGLMLFITGCAIYFIDNYTTDLDYFTPNW